MKIFGSFLSFKIGPGLFAAKLENVNEILGYKPISAMPYKSNFIVGFIYFKKSHLPVIDIRHKLNIHQPRDAKKSFMVIVQVKFQERGLKMGVLIDEINQIFEISEGHFKSENSEEMRLCKLEGIRGVYGSFEDISLLNFNSFFTMEELDSIRRATNLLKATRKSIVGQQKYEGRIRI